MKNKKGNTAPIVIIVIILLVTIGVFGWMYFKKSSIPAMQTVGFTKEVKQVGVLDGWKTYANDKHGYLIGYPADWKFDDYKMDTVKEFLDDNVSFTNPKSIGSADSINDGKKGSIEIFVFTNFKSPKPTLIKDKTVPTLGEWKAGTAKRPGSTNGQSEFLPDENVAGMRCAVNRIQFHLQKYCVKDDKGYLFSISTNGPIDDATGEKIISTFKFTR